jgi:hypothetical protein
MAMLGFSLHLNSTGSHCALRSPLEKEHTGARHMVWHLNLLHMTDFFLDRGLGGYILVF